MPTIKSGTAGSRVASGEAPAKSSPRSRVAASEANTSKPANKVVVATPSTRPGRVASSEAPAQKPSKKVATSESNSSFEAKKPRKSGPSINPPAGTRVSRSDGVKVSGGESR